MRYINKINCKSAFERGESKEITSMGKLTRETTRIAENKDLGLLRTRMNTYKIIKKSGLGAGIDEVFTTLGEVDRYLKNL